MFVVALAVPASAQHEHHGAPPSTTRPVVIDTLSAHAQRDAVLLRSGVTSVDVRTSAAAGGSVADLLRTVPGIDVDADGRLRMRGDGSVIVLVNGRRIALRGDALTAFLRQMPASALTRIDVATTSSVRHDADAAAGVVNLVFGDDAIRRTRTRSLAGSLASDDHYMGSVAATGTLREVADWDAAYSVSGMRPRTLTASSRWSLVPGDLALHTDEDSRARARHRLHSAVIGAAIHPAPGISLALRGAGSWMEGAYRNITTFAYRDAADNTASSAVGSLLEHEIPSASLHAVASVRRGRAHWTSDVSASRTREDFRGDYRDLVRDYSYMTTTMLARQREHVFRNDVTFGFDGLMLDIGHESRFGHLAATHVAAHFTDVRAQAYRYDSRVHAGYAAVRGERGVLRTEAGLRVEADRTVLRFQGDSVRTDLRVFPGASAEWSDEGRGLTYRLAYSRGIRRPEPEMLNPLSMGEDDMNEIIGNPSLLPETSERLEIGVERHRSRLTLQVTPFVRRSDNPIRPLKASTATGGSTTTLTNLTSSRAFGADASIRLRPTDGTVLTLAGTVMEMSTEGTVLGRRGVYASMQLTVDVQLAEGTTAQFYAHRRSALPVEQGEILPALVTDLMLTQRLAGNRGRVTLRVSDPLRSDATEFQIADASFTQWSRRRTAPPLLSLFASWAVGGAPREDQPSRATEPGRIF